MLVERRLEIVAAPDRIWSVMIDVERWPEWTASVRSVERLDAGDFGPGSRVRIKQPRLPRAVWEVTELEEGRGFRWATRSPGAITVADHELRPLPEGGAELTLRVVQTGAAARLMGPLYEGLVERYVEMEAQGLKARCEAGGG